MRTLQDIGRDIATQDNLATALPIFFVQQKCSRVVPADEADVDDPVWVDMDNIGDEVDDDLAADLEELHQDGDPVPAQYRRAQRVSWWENVTACFTRVGCEEYLRVNGHNLHEPRIYVGCAYRNAEWELVREHLLGGVGR